MSLSGLLVFGRVPSFGFRLKRAVSTSVLVQVKSAPVSILPVEGLGNSRNSFLSPVEVSLNLFCRFHAICEIGSGTFQASLRERL